MCTLPLANMLAGTPDMPTWGTACANTSSILGGQLRVRGPPIFPTHIVCCALHKLCFCYHLMRFCKDSIPALVWAIAMTIPTHITLRHVWHGVWCFALHAPPQTPGAPVPHTWSTPVPSAGFSWRRVGQIPSAMHGHPLAGKWPLQAQGTGLRVVLLWMQG